MRGIQSCRMDPKIYRQDAVKIQSFGVALQKHIFALNLTENEIKGRKLIKAKQI